MAEVRPDQARDKDSIQRDTITAKIVGPIDMPILRDDEKGIWTLFFFEPGPHPTSTVIPAKFAFEFRSLKQIEDIVESLQLEIKEWHDRGYQD